MIGEARLARRPGVPAHERYVFADKTSKYAVAVFCINEGERIRAQLARMAPLADQADIIVADGGSTDGSLDRKTLLDFRLRALLIKRDKGKLSAQMRMAMAFAIEEGYQGLIVIDGNGKDDVTAIPRFIELLDEGYDHIQGSRYIPGGKGVNTPIARHIGVKLLHAPVLSAAARRRYTDTTNGFRGYSRKLLTDMRVSPLRDVFLGYELHYYLAIRAARLGYKVIETPVTRAYPRDGATPTKINGVRGNLEVLKTLASVVRGEFDPDRTRDNEDESTGEWPGSARNDT
jgi:dolichol-phosphate mannosyltransferase